MASLLWKRTSRRVPTTGCVAFPSPSQRRERTDCRISHARTPYGMKTPESPRSPGKARTPSWGRCRKDIPSRHRPYRKSSHRCGPAPSVCRKCPPGISFSESALLALLDYTNICSYYIERHSASPPLRRGSKQSACRTDSPKASLRANRRP